MAAGLQWFIDGMRPLAKYVIVLFPSSIYCALAISWSALELALLATHEQALWSEAGLPWHGRVVFATVSVVCTAAAISPIFWCTNGLALLSRRGKLARVMSSCCAVSGTFVATLVYLSSWAFYWHTGMFADRYSIIFATRNLYMLCQYMWQAEPSVAVALTLLSLLIAIISGVATYLAGALTRRTSPHNASGKWYLFDGLLAMTSALSIAGAAASLYDDSHDPARQTDQWWSDLRHRRSFDFAYRVHPFITATADPALVPKLRTTAIIADELMGPPRLATDANVRSPSKIKSIILIEMESLRHDVLFATHQSKEITPVLNRLAFEGIAFTNAYAQSSHSNYADPAIVSSLYPLRTEHQHYYSVADPWPTVRLYDVAKSYGCSTAIISSQNES